MSWLSAPRSSSFSRSFALFAKLFSVTVLAIVIIGTVLDLLLDGLQDDSVMQQQSSVVQQLAESLSKVPDPSANLLVEAAGQLEFIEKTRLSLSDALQTRLASGEVVQLESQTGANFLLLPLAHSPNYLLKVALPEIQESASSWYVALIYYALIAFVLTLLFLPLSRDISAIKDHIGQIGRNEFSKLPNLQQFSWLKDFAEVNNQMVERIQLLLNSQKELTYGVSHELRTPLSRLKFSLELIDVDQASVKQSKLSMQQDIKDLEALIDELLDYAKYDHDDLHVHLTRVSIAPWLIEIVNRLGINLVNIDCHCDFGADSADLTVVIDPSLSQRAIENIILNADKYARSALVITLEDQEEHLLIHFDDDGPGIPRSEWSTVFEAFKRLDANTTKAGWGLGLAMSKRIMQRQHGKISIGQSQQGGARFTLTFNKQPQIHIRQGPSISAL